MNKIALKQINAPILAPTSPSPTMGLTDLRKVPRVKYFCLGICGDSMTMSLCGTANLSETVEASRKRAYAGNVALFPRAREHLFVKCHSRRVLLAVVRRAPGPPSVHLRPRNAEERPQQHIL